MQTFVLFITIIHSLLTIALTISSNKCLEVKTIHSLICVFNMAEDFQVLVNLIGINDTH